MDELKQYFFGSASERTMKRARTIFDKLNYKSTLIQKGMMYSLSFYFSSQREYDGCIEEYNKHVKIRTIRKINATESQKTNIIKLNQWMKAHPDEARPVWREAQKRQHQKPLKRLRAKERKKRYAETHRDEIKTQQNRYYKEHPDKRNAKQTRYRTKYKDEINAKQTIYMAKYRTKHKEELNRKARERYAKQRMQG